MLHLLGKRLEELTDDDLRGVASALKINVQVSPELRTAVMTLLKGQDIHSVSDLIKSPEAVKELMSFLSAPKPEQDTASVLSCPHCSQFFKVTANV